MKDIYLILIGLVVAIPITALLLKQPAKEYHLIVRGEECWLTVKDIKKEIKYGYKAIKKLQKISDKHPDQKEIIEENNAWIADWYEQIKAYYLILEQIGGMEDE